MNSQSLLTGFSVGYLTVLFQLQMLFNPLMPNDFSRHHAVSPLNSQTASKDVTNSVLKFGGILFTPFWLTAVSCYAAGPLKVRFSFRSHNVPPPPPKPLHKHQYICRRLVTVHFSQLTNMILTWLALIIACCGVHSGLKYQHWPMKWKIFLDQKGCQWRTVLI